jgi:peptide/nickel transport system substrate-binding protein
MPTVPHRRSRIRPAAVIAGVVAMAIALAGCSGSDPNSASAKKTSAPTTLVVAYRNQVTTIDPLRADYVQSDTVDQGLYDTLVTYDAKDRIVPMVASSAAYNSAVDAVDVTLRSGVTFHDGSPLTATDVKFSLDRDKQLGIGIDGQIPSYASTEVINDHKLVIHLTKPDALFLGALSRIYILNSKLVQQHEGSDNAQGWLLDHDAGSGSYTLRSISNGTYTLGRYAKYWKFNSARPNTLVLRRIDDPTTTKQELVAGNVDIGDINATDVSSAKSAGLNVVESGTAGAYVYFNDSQGPTANVAVRKAITLAYDYTGGLAKFRGNLGKLANGPLPTDLACRPDLPTVKQDLTEAKKTLADAGITNLTLTMRFQPAFAEQAEEATLLQSNLKSIGITVNLQPIAFADYLTLLDNFSSVPQLMLATDAPPYPDAGVMITQEFNSAAVGTNKDAYSNPQVDKLLAQATGEPNADARCTIYKKVQTIVSQDYGIMPMYTPYTPIASAKNVVGAGLSAPNGSLAIAELTVK